MSQASPARPGHRRIDLAGRRFGRLVAHAPEYPNGQRALHWRCVCDCGRQTVVNGASLRRGATSSCGCISSETTARRNRSHGKSKTQTYRVWASMLARCYNPNTRPWPWYGGRGICVCDLWRHSYEEFLRDMGERPSGMEIDRVDPDGNYSPLNCRWANADTQGANKVKRATLSLHGRTQTVVQWAKETGIPVTVLYQRIYARHPDDVVLSMPYRPGRQRKPRHQEAT